MRILSKSQRAATALALALLTSSCARYLPWRKDIPTPEVNLAFTLERNLVKLQTVRLDNRPGRFLLGTAAPRTVIDPDFTIARSRHALQLNGKETVRVSPHRVDLGGVADGIIGAEPWGGRAITIDYHSGLVTYQKEGIHTGMMTIYRYDGPPAIHVNVDGRNVAAIVDTTSPDTIVLPRAERGRGTARITIDGAEFGAIDVGYANIAQARVGNRLLSKFMVTIDYGKQLVGLWRDPRIAMAAIPAP